MRALTLPALSAALLLALTGCSGDEPAALPTPASVAASPTYDQATLTACEKARAATEGTEADDRAVFLLEARAAQREAAGSGDESLRAVVAEHGSGPGGSVVEDAEATAVVFAVRAWCVSHQLG